MGRSEIGWFANDEIFVEDCFWILTIDIENQLLLEMPRKLFDKNRRKIETPERNLKVERSRTVETTKV